MNGEKSHMGENLSGSGENKGSDFGPVITKTELTLRFCLEAIMIVNGENGQW
jgi:hypothetical protein